jgi:hypothetical protein
MIEKYAFLVDVMHFACKKEIGEEIIEKIKELEKSIEDDELIETKIVNRSTNYISTFDITTTDLCSFFTIKSKIGEFKGHTGIRISQWPENN